jgi:hypothetical protein
MISIPKDREIPCEVVRDTIDRTEANERRRDELLVGADRLEEVGLLSLARKMRVDARKLEDAMSAIVNYADEWQYDEYDYPDYEG